MTDNLKEVQWLGGPQDGLKINVHKDAQEVVISVLMVNPLKEEEPSPYGLEVPKIICPIRGRFIIWPYDKV